MRHHPPQHLIRALALFIYSGRKRILRLRDLPRLETISAQRPEEVLMAQPMATFLPDLSSSRNSGMPARKTRTSRLGTSAGHGTAYGKCDWACEAGGAAGVRRTCGAGLVGHVCLSLLRHATHNRHQPQPQQLEHTRHGRAVGTIPLLENSASIGRNLPEIE